MDEDEFEEYEFIEWEPPNRKFRPIDLAVLGLNLIRGLSAAITDTLGLAQQLVAAHANHQIMREDFHEQAAREIETLTNGD